MKKLLLSILFAVSVFAQNTFPYTVSPTQFSGSVTAFTSTPIQQISTPVVVSLPGEPSPTNPETVRAFTVFVPPLADVNGNINNGMFSFTFVGASASNGNEALVNTGQSVNVYLSVDTSKLPVGSYGVPIFIQDVQTGLTVDSYLSLTELNSRVYVYPANNVRVVPHIATGLGWQTTLEFTNPNSSATLVDVHFADQSGNPMPVSLTDGRYTSAALVSIAANTVASIVVAQPTAAYTIIGTATIVPVSGYPVGVTAIYAATSLAPVHKAAIAAQQVITNTLTMFYDNTGGQTAGVALMNSLNYAEPVTLTLFDEFGAVLETKVQTIPAGGQVALVLSDSVLQGHTGVMRASMGFVALSGFALQFDSNFFFVPIVPIPY